MGDKHTWTNDQIKFLLHTCIEEVHTVGRKGLSLHKHTWNKLGTAIKEKFGVDLTQRQLKNAYDNLKAKYTGWIYLKNKTGNLYNPQTNSFNLTNEEWEDFKKGHPKAASLKTVPLLYPELCADLFDGNSASGNLSYATSQTPSGHGSSSCQVAPLQLMDTPSINIDDDDYFSHRTSESFGASPSGASPSGASPSAASPSAASPPGASPYGVSPPAASPSAASPPGASPSAASPAPNPKKRARPDPHSSASPKNSITADDLALEMQKALRHLTQGPTVPQCLEKLQLLQLSPTDPLQCVELLRMSRESFVRLCAHFRVNYALKDSKHVSVEEKMAMFLMMIGHNQRYVIIKRRFQHSKQTIHKFFHEVLDKMLLFAHDIIVSGSFNPNPNFPGHNRRLRRVFKGAVGALDGTLIHAVVPANKQDLYRSRGKGDCYQNVLAICDFNMMFTFVVAGWEGVAHDSRILSEALANPHAPFPLPPSDKYYLCDAAYAHTRGFMAPYRNVRYWLGDFRQRRALTNKEKFNHAHAKLRNVIERAFGVLKARFPILKRMAPFSLVTQRNITLACFALHNFIRREGLSDEYFARYDEPNVSVRNNNVPVDDDEDDIPTHGTAADREYMTQLRDEIAEQLMQNME